MKDAAGKLTASVQGLGGIFAGDEGVKGGMAGYTFKHFEISAYSALVAAAEIVWDQQTATVCRETLAEEQAMADWLKEHLPSVIQQYLQCEEVREPAKR